MYITGPRRESETKNAYMLRIWHNMTPEQRDYDRFVARSIPVGATRGAETEGGRKAEAERDKRVDGDYDADGCSCHMSAPCGYCTRDIEDE